MTNQANKTVGTMTMVNLTGNELEVWVNSKRTSYIIKEMQEGKTTFREEDASPISAGETGGLEKLSESDLVGFKPSTKTFLRALETRPGYFHNGTNVVTVDRGGVSKDYTFEISGQDHQVLSHSATITITRGSFIVAAPNGEVWYQMRD